MSVLANLSSQLLPIMPSVSLFEVFTGVILEGAIGHKPLTQVYAVATHTASLPAVLDGPDNDLDDGPGNDPDDGTGDGTGCVGKTVLEVSGTVERMYNDR